MTSLSSLEDTEALRQQLEEAQETLRAIRSGEVDALILTEDQGHQLCHLKAAEESNRIFLETMHEGAVTLLPDGTIVYCNGRFADLLGTSAERLIGSAVDSFVAPAYRDRLRPLPKEATLGHCTEVVPLLTGDGSTLWAELSMCPVKVDSSTRICMTAGDITERKKAEELRRAYMASIVDSTDDAIIGMNLDGLILSWNAGAERLYGFSVKEIIGQSLLTLVPLDHAEAVRGILERMARGERMVNHETEGISKEGARVHLAFTVSPVADLDGRIVGGSAIARDITGRKRAQLELALQAQELTRSNSELQQFAYVASHDLQEPLRAVSTFMRLLADRYRGQLDAEADEYIRFAVDAALRSQRLIQDLLTYSRIGTRSASFAPVDCETVLSNTLADLAAALRESGGKVTHSSLPQIAADRSQIGQVFQNLIGNALKFHGSESPRVHVDAQRIPGGWRLSVSDNGIGIERRHQEEIFAVFRRLHSSEEYPGTGIGLAITKKIVERHGGRIWLESEPGKGTTFYFTIPTPAPRQNTREVETA